MSAEGELTTVLEPRALPDFVETDFVRGIVDRALTYLAAGFPVHLRGGAGTGKTTLAVHIAGKLRRPVVMIHGDEEFSTSDLIGAEQGYWSRRIVDNFIHSVLKAEEEVSPRWVDNRLTVAVKHGFTLLYDEFTRSRPEANNVLLAVLQERMLDLPIAGADGNYLSVHPEFSAIFTSNPDDYAGVYRSQDALLDRMVTLDLKEFDQETEVAITVAKSGLELGPAERVVSLIRALRETNACEVPPTVRSCIKIGRATRVRGASIAAQDNLFRQICLDVLASGSTRGGSGPLRHVEELDNLIERLCGNGQSTAAPAEMPGRRGQEEVT